MRITHGDVPTWETVIRTGEESAYCGQGGVGDHTNSEVGAGQHDDRIL